MESENRINNEKVMILLEKMTRIEAIINQFILMVNKKTA